MPRQRSKEKYNKLHSEIISKRHQKKEKKKKKSIIKIKNQKLKEYLDLEKLNESQEKKTTAMNLMNLIEDIKDEGLNDKRYMDIMDQLMILHKQDGKRINVLDTFNEFTQRTPLVNEGGAVVWREDSFGNWNTVRYRDMMFRNPPTYEFINNGVINTDYNDMYTEADGLPVNDGYFEDPEDVD